MAANMQDIAAHVMDIAQNSVRAGATRIEIEYRESRTEDSLTVVVRDNGRGMTAETLARVTDPFFTSRTTRKVGLGIPLLKQNAERTGGSFAIESREGEGTTVRAVFRLSDWDTPPAGDLGGRWRFWRRPTRESTSCTGTRRDVGRTCSTRGRYGRRWATCPSTIPRSPPRWRRWRGRISETYHESNIGIKNYANCMEKIKSLSDLKRIKEQVREKLDLREKSEQADRLVQIKVAMGTCGIASGSKETMSYFIDHLAENGVNAIVTQTGCMGYCYAEPTVEITKPGREPIVFGRVTPEKAAEIIEKYLKNDELVEGIIPANYQSIQ